MNRLKIETHSIIDYLTVVLLIGCGLSGYFTPYFSKLLMILGGIHLLLTLFSHSKFGLVKLIPMKIHGYIELVVSIALIPAPFLLGYSDDEHAKCFTWGFAFVVFCLYVITDYAHRADSMKRVP